MSEDIHFRNILKHLSEVNKHLEKIPEEFLATKTLSEEEKREFSRVMYELEIGFAKVVSLIARKRGKALPFIANKKDIDEVLKI